VLPSEERGLLPGLVDGDTNGLDPVLAERFRVAGLTHLVAVSGTNCSIVIGIVLLVLRRTGARPWLCAVAGALALVLFVIVARPSPSVLRAAAMAGIALASLAAGRPRQALPGLAASVLGLLIWQPALAIDAGFTMSVLATGALLLIAPGWAVWLRRRHVPPGLAEAVAVAAAAHVVTAPVIAALAGRVSLVAVPANVLAEPAVVPATVFGFAAAVLAPVWLGGAEALAWVAGWPCRWLVWIADRAGGLGGASLSWPGGAAGGLALVAVTVGAFAMARRAGLWRLLPAAALIAVLVQIPVRSVAVGWPPAGWVMVACDVGQGDAIVLAAAPHAAVEVDAGPDPVAVDRCLRGLGISEVSMLILSHYHLDHVGGIAGVFRGRRVDRVITGPLAEPVSGVDLVHDVVTQHGMTVLTPSSGSQFQVGGVRLELLGPAVAFHDTRSDPNNSSLIVRATVGDTRILLPGDAEIEAQQAILAAGVDVRADVLKVPHHGSAYSDPAFLAAVHARVAVISVGLHNDYGHPSPLLLTELARLAIPVRRTDRDGDIAVVGPAVGLTTVVRGTAASVAALARVSAPAVPEAASALDARMVAWQPPAPSAPSPSTTCPIRCPRWSCSSVMMTCSSLGPSARSPPPHGGRRPTSSRLSEPATRSRVPNCTNCSDHRCSATPDCSSSAPHRTCAVPRWRSSRHIWTRRRTPPRSSFSTPVPRRGRRCSTRSASSGRLRFHAPN
jgi:competence protein ComEC